MMTTIMRVFTAYKVPDLLYTPLCHVKALYRLAERASTLNSWDGAISQAILHEEKLSNNIQQVVKQCTEVDKEYLAKVLSEENKNRVLRRIEQRRSNG